MMTRARRATIYSLLAILVGGHVIDIVTQKEHWPFSRYPMFSNVADPSLHTYQLTCLYRDPTGITREAFFDPNWVPTLPQYKFMDLLRHNLDGKEPNPVHLRQMLNDYLATYDACRREGLSHGPDIQAVRLYRVDVPLEVPLRRVDFEHDFTTYAQMAVQVDRPAVHATTRPVKAPSDGLRSAKI